MSWHDVSCLGHVVVVLWSCHGCVMIVLCLNSAVAVFVSWLCYGHVIVTLFRGCVMVVLWSCLSSWLCCGCGVIVSSHIMVLPCSCHVVVTSCTKGLND